MLLRRIKYVFVAYPKRHTQSWQNVYSISFVCRRCTTDTKCNISVCSTITNKIGETVENFLRYRSSTTEPVSTLCAMVEMLCVRLCVFLFACALRNCVRNFAGIVCQLHIYVSWFECSWQTLCHYNEKSNHRIPKCVKITNRYIHRDIAVIVPVITSHSSIVRFCAIGNISNSPYQQPTTTTTEHASIYK